MSVSRLLLISTRGKHHLQVHTTNIPVRIGWNVWKMRLRHTVLGLTDPPGVQRLKPKPLDAAAAIRSVPPYDVSDETRR
jgi:hypothetical protein